MRKNVVGGQRGRRPAVGVEVGGQQEEWAGRWVKTPVRHPGDMLEGGRDTTPRAPGRGGKPGLPGLWGTGSHEDGGAPGCVQVPREALQDLGLGTASGDAAGRSERTELSTALGNAVTADLGDFSGVTMFWSLRALVSLHIDC